MFRTSRAGPVRENDGGFSVPLAYSMYYVWGTRMLTGDYNYELGAFPLMASGSRPTRTAGRWGNLGCMKSGLLLS